MISDDIDKQLSQEDSNALPLWCKYEYIVREIAKYDGAVCKLLFSLSKRTRTALIPMKLGVRCLNETRKTDIISTDYLSDGGKECIDKFWQRILHKNVVGSRWIRRIFKQSITYDIPSRYRHCRVIGFHKTIELENQDNIGYYLLSARSRIECNITTIEEEAKTLQDMVLAGNERHQNCCVTILQIDGRSSIDVALVSSTNEDPSRIYNIMYFMLECGKEKQSKNTIVNADYHQDDVKIDKLITYLELLSPQEPLKLSDTFIVSLEHDRPGDWRFAKVLFDDIVLLENQWIVVPYYNDNASYNNDNDLFLISIWKVVNDKKIEFIRSRFFRTEDGPVADFTITMQNLDIIFDGFYKCGKRIRTLLWSTSKLNTCPTTPPPPTDIQNKYGYAKLNVSKNCLLGTIGQSLTHWTQSTPVSYNRNFSEDYQLLELLEKNLFQYLYDNKHISLNTLIQMRDKALELLIDLMEDPILPDFVLPINLPSSELNLQLIATCDGLFILSNILESGHYEPFGMGFIQNGIDEIVTFDGVIIIRSGARIFTIFLPNSIIPSTQINILNNYYLKDEGTKRNDANGCDRKRSLLRIHEITDDNNGDRRLFLAIEEDEFDDNKTLIKEFSLKIKPTNMKLVPLVNDSGIFYRILLFYRLDVRYIDISGPNGGGTITTTKNNAVSQRSEDRRIIRIERGKITFKSKEDVKNDEIKDSCLSVPYLIASYRSQRIVIWDIVKKNLVFEYRADEVQPVSTNRLLGCIFKLNDGTCSILSDLFNRYYRHIELTPNIMKEKRPIIIKECNEDEEFNDGLSTDSNSCSVAPSLTKLSLLVYDTPGIPKEIQSQDLSILNEMINILWELHNFYIVSGDNMKLTDVSKALDTGSIQEFPSLDEQAKEPTITSSQSQWATKPKLETVTVKESHNENSVYTRSYLLNKLEDIVDKFPVLNYPYLTHELVLALTQASAVAQLYADIAPDSDIKALLHDNNDDDDKVSEKSDQIGGGGGGGFHSKYDKELNDIMGRKWNYLRGDARALLMGEAGWRRKENFDMELSDYVYDSSGLESSDTPYRYKKGILNVMIDPDVGYLTFDSKRKIIHIEYI